MNDFEIAERQVAHDLCYETGNHGEQIYLGLAAETRIAMALGECRHATVNAIANYFAKVGESLKAEIEHETNAAIRASITARADLYLTASAAILDLPIADGAPDA